MDIVSSEATAWLRCADATGLKLPADVLEARKRLNHTERELFKLDTAPEAQSPAALIASGASAADAFKRAEKSATDTAKLAETRRIAVEGRALARRRLSLAVAEHRDELIVSVRPVVLDLLEQAHPTALELAPFAPRYEVVSIMRKGTPEQIDCWRHAEALEREFGTIIAAWRASFKTARSKAGAFDYREVAQAYWFWTNPELVTNARLNGTARGLHGVALNIEPTILGVASESADAGFRLATLGELAQFFKGRVRA